MKRIIFLVTIAVITLTGCNKSTLKQCTSECVENKIDGFKKEVCEEGSNVKKYKFQGKTVFVFDKGTCGADLTSEVIDSECNSLGYLGGIMGNTKINGDDFSKAMYITTIWKK